MMMNNILLLGINSQTVFKVQISNIILNIELIQESQVQVTGFPGQTDMLLLRKQTHSVLFVIFLS